MLTPLVFAPLAGSIAVLAARHFPGVDIDQGSLQAIFVAGATIAFGKAALWLKGWQDWEKREAAGAGEEPLLHEDPVLDDDPTADGAFDFDDSDLADLLPAQLAADEDGASA